MQCASVFGIVWTSGDADELVSKLVRADIPARDVSLATRAFHRMPDSLRRALRAVGSFVVGGVGVCHLGGRAAVVFAAEGSAVRGLTHLGMSARHAGEYTRDLQRGGIVIGVRAQGELRRMIAEELLRANHALDMVTSEAPPRPIVVTSPEVSPAPG